jgi:protoporphyrinogen oxidase
MKCTEISADWAAQRIKGLSLYSAIWSAIKPGRKKKGGAVIKTLISTFRYPRLGPGMMWESAAKKTVAQGGEIKMGCRVEGLRYEAANRKWTVQYRENENEVREVEADHVISTAPVREIMAGLQPEPTSLAASQKLKYRDFLTVAIILKDRDVFDDNWIYIHDSAVKVGRIQNFKSWSPDLIAGSELCCYGLEYFCFEGDGLWTSEDADLIELARKEIEYLGLAKADDVLDGCVVRQPKAYPVYDDEYSQNMDAVRKELKDAYPNLHLVGRNGMHKYNNQDHAMMTAMLTVENIIEGCQKYDVWQVNEDAEYHESGEAGQESGVSGLRAVPKPAGES